jgi:tetratricopeptide (TPR) repeat protein
MSSGLRTRVLGAGTLVNVWEVMTVKSTQRHAVTVASLMGLMLAAAPLLAQPGQQPAQRGGPPNPDTPQILVAVLQSTDKVLGVETADEIRHRIQQEHSAKELYAVPKTSINNTLEASGYKADSALNASDLMELAKQVHGDYVLEGKLVKTGSGLQLDARLLTRTGQQTLAQPLPSITGKDPGDVAKLVEREISAALKGMGPYKTCTNDLRAAKYEQAVKDAQVGLTAYPNSTLNRLCILTAYNQLKSPPDSIIAISEAILAKDPTSIIALNSAAEAYTAKGDKDKAIEYNLRIWRADPSNTTIATSIVNILATSGSPDKAIPIIDTLLAQNPGDPAMLDTKWKLLLNAKRWKEAIAAGEEVAKADTSKATLAFFQRQIGAAQNDSNTAKVQEIASRAAAKFPKDLDMQLLLTQSYRKSGQLQQALEHGRQAIAIDPKSTNAVVLTMYTLNDLKQKDSATAVAQRAIAAGVSKDTIGALLLADVPPMVKAAQESKKREDWEAALAAAQAVDAMAPTKESKFFIGVSSFSVAYDIVQHIQTLTKSTKKEDRATMCTEAKQVDDLLAVTQMAMPVGGAVDKNTAAQILGAVPQITDFTGEIKKKICK